MKTNTSADTLEALPSLKDPSSCVSACEPSSHVLELFRLLHYISRPPPQPRHDTTPSPGAATAAFLLRRNPAGGLLQLKHVRSPNVPPWPRCSDGKEQTGHSGLHDSSAAWGQSSGRTIFYGCRVTWSDFICASLFVVILFKEIPLHQKVLSAVISQGSISAFIFLLMLLLSDALHWSSPFTPDKADTEQLLLSFCAL